MSVNLSPIGGAAAQFFDNNGNPLAGGKLYTYAAGTTTPRAAYTTIAGNVPHTNPIILDSAGRVPGGQIWLTDGNVDYKFLLETSASVLVGTFDNIPPAVSGTSADIEYLPAGTGAVATTVQGKLRESVSLEDFGASSTSTPTQNAAAFIAALGSSLPITAAARPYTFQFGGGPITLAGTKLVLDLGEFKHTFLNFGGLESLSLTHFKYNGRFSAGGGYCKGLMRARNLQIVDIDTIEITDVYNNNADSTKQFFAVEYSSSLHADNPMKLTCANAVFENLVTQTVTVAAGSPVSMTAFGNFGSSSSQVALHQLSFGNFTVNNFYSVASNGTTIIDGDSDVFRLFTNPTQLVINNLVSVNTGKRFIKTQEQTDVVINNLYASLDARFSNTNFIGMLEGQDANSGKITKFMIGHAEVDFSLAAGRPIFFNASGLNHQMSVNSLVYNNIAVFSQSQNIAFTVNRARGVGLAVNAAFSTQVVLKDFEDTSLVSVICADCTIDGFRITFSPTVAVFPLQNCRLRNGVFPNLRSTQRVATYFEITNVVMAYTSGASYLRALHPKSGFTCTVQGLSVSDTTGLITQLFESPGVGTSGTLIFRDVRLSGSAGLAFISLGSWSVVRDNCTNDTVTGVGVVSSLKAAYPITNTATLDFPVADATSVARLTIPLVGAALGDNVVLGVPNASVTTTASYSAWVSAADVVTVQFSPKGAEDPVSGLFRVSVIKF